MEKKKLNLLSVLKLIGLILIVIGFVFCFIKFRTGDCSHRLNHEIISNSLEAEVYQTNLTGNIYNNTDKVIEGTLYVKFVDDNGQKITATFGNVKLTANGEIEIDSSNNSIPTNINNENGLSYDYEIKEVHIGETQVMSIKSKPTIYLPLLIGGVILCLIPYIIETSKKGNEELEESQSIK